jgi:hypothetical protein
MDLHRQEEQFYLSRFIFLRALGGIYAVAFLCLYNDVLPLIGSKGLLPAELFIDHVQVILGGRWEAMVELPSIFHYLISDALLKSLSFLGFLLSLVVMIRWCNGVILFVLWALYFSFVSIGQTWYSFGWESQLLETGLLAVFLVPFINPKPFISRPPKIIIAMAWWLIFRIMFGAGLIKIRGDGCWTDLSCLFYHFETQPVPNPLSIFFHNLPLWCLELGVIINHFVELIIPFFLLGPRKIRNTAAVIMILFQVFLILSGNLSFLNWLTILPCLLCIDDSFWKKVTPYTLHLQIPMMHDKTTHRQSLPRYLYAILVGYLSIPVVQNLLSSEQSMNRSFDSLRIVNTYGAFGSVGDIRTEVVIEGQTSNGIWKEYEFKCKPGSIDRMPCWISPYHYRLDWLIWFAGIEAGYGEGVKRHRWVINLMWKLLHNDPLASQLMNDNPFAKTPPVQIRISTYEYRFAQLDSEYWWERERTGIYVPPLNKNDPDLISFITQNQWNLSTSNQ